MWVLERRTWDFAGRSKFLSLLLRTATSVTVINIVVDVVIIVILLLLLTLFLMLLLSLRYTTVFNYVVYVVIVVIKLLRTISWWIALAMEPALVTRLLYERTTYTCLFR